MEKVNAVLRELPLPCTPTMDISRAAIAAIAAIAAVLDAIAEPSEAQPAAPPADVTRAMARLFKRVLGSGRRYQCQRV